MEFLREYWPLLVCVVLIIIAVVVLIVFRDKPEDKNVEADKTSDIAIDENKTEAAKPVENTKVKEETEIANETPSEDEIKPVEEQPTEEKPEEKVEEKKQKPKKAKAKKTEKVASESDNSDATINEPAKEEVETATEQTSVQPSQTETVEEENTEVEGEKMEDKKPSQKYMVTYDKDRKDWVVKKTGATRASKRCKTKKEAMEVAEKLAESQDLNISVKKKDGKFQKRENASK